MMVRIKLMLLDLLRIDATDCALRKLLTNTWIQLTHLRALTNTETFVLEDFRSLNCAFASRGPNSEGAKRSI